MRHLWLLLLLAPSAFAQQDYPRDITLTWTWPTLYTDNTVIQPGDLRGAFITCDRQDGTRVIDTEIPITTALGSTQTEVFVGFIPQPGTYTCFSFAITVDDISSDPSNPASKKYTGKPLPITSFTAE